MAEAAERALAHVAFKPNPRVAIDGLGHGVGLLRAKDGTRLYLPRLSKAEEQTVMILNYLFRLAAPICGVVRWSTLQLNKNSRAREHVDKNNLGPSMLVALGDFVMGLFWLQGHGQSLVCGPGDRRSDGVSLSQNLYSAFRSLNKRQTTRVNEIPRFATDFARAYT